MRPSDPRLRAQLAPARSELVGVAVSGTATGLLVIAQAWAVAGLVVATIHGTGVTPWAVAVVGVLAARGLFGALGDVAAARAAGVVGTLLRRRLLLVALTRHEEATGELSVLATRGVSAAEPFLTRYVPALVLAGVLPPLTVIAIATQDLLSAVIVVATLPLVPVFGALVGLATRDRAEEQWRALSALSGHFLDVVRGLPTLVAFRRARAQSGRIAEITDRYRQASLRTLRIAFASSMVLELVATLSVALVAVTVGVRLASGSLGLHTALVVLLLAPEAYWPLRRVGAEFHAAAEGATTFAAAHDVLATEDGPAVSCAAGDGVPLVLDSVTVFHPGRTTPAVDRLSATIPAAGMTVVTGPSGCGKSTLLATVAGLLPLTSGTLTAAGRPLRGPAWQRQVAWLPQQPTFIGGTIADNLRLARPSATDEQLWSALRQVALEERVRALIDGLHAPLGEDGGTLSAGERARLALARIVLAERPWVLLDEPTAHLDELTEQIILDTIAELGQRSAVLVVAHRPALIALADHRIELARTPSAPRPAARSSAKVPPAALPPQASGSPEQPRGFLGATALGALASASGVALTTTAGWLIVQASTAPPVLTLLVAIVGVRTFGLARPVLRYVERLRSHDDALRLLARRRVEVYDALVPLVPGRLGRRRGDLLSAVVDDVDSVVDRELRVRMPVRQYALVALLASCVAALAHPPAAAVVAAFSVVAGAGSFLVARRAALHREPALIELRAELSAEVVESLQVADELVMWQAGVPAADRVAHTSARISAIATRAAVRLASARALALIAAGVAMALVAAITTGAVADGSLSAPVMALLVLMPLALVDLALPLADAGALSARAAATDERLRFLAHRAPAVRDTVAIAAPAGTAVHVDRVRARWAEDAPASQEVSFALAPGDRVAVTGASGSGKSTLAALLLRFLDPTAGGVTLGGADLRDLPLDDVRRLTGLVDDHPYVFATTLVENIRLARPDACDAQVETALRRACLGGWLDDLPDGLHTWLGDGHAGVSGGERARIGVARSLLAEQPVLVLDEPSAHLDHATATDLAAELLTGPRDRAVLWITHGHVGLDLVDGIIDLDATRDTSQLA